MDGQLHPMAHSLGACASKRKLLLNPTTATLPTVNGLAILENLTKAEDLSNYLGNYYLYSSFIYLSIIYLVRLINHQMYIICMYICLWFKLFIYSTYTCAGITIMDQQGRPWGLMG